MSTIFLIAFIMTLIYLSIANRMRGYISMLTFQGMLLFGLSFIELRDIHPGNLLFILLETIIFKTIAVPVFLAYIVRKNKIHREVEPYMHYFISLVTVTLFVFLTFLLSNTVDDNHLNKIFFVASLSSLFTGLYLIISRKKIITHVMAFLVIENGVFILSLAVGAEMPMMVSIGILLDLFVTVLLLGVFVNKIGEVLKDMNVEQLQNLKD